jgi:hypothetical protein
MRQQMARAIVPVVEIARDDERSIIGNHAPDALDQGTELLFASAREQAEMHA